MDAETLKRDLRSFEVDFKTVIANLGELSEKYRLQSDGLFDAAGKYYSLPRSDKLDKEVQQQLVVKVQEVLPAMKLLHRYGRFVAHKMKKLRKEISKLKKETSSIKEEDLPREIQDLVATSPYQVKSIEMMIITLERLAEDKQKWLMQRMKQLKSFSSNLEKGKLRKSYREFMNPFVQIYDADNSYDRINTAYSDYLTFQKEMAKVEQRKKEWIDFFSSNTKDTGMVAESTGTWLALNIVGNVLIWTSGVFWPLAWSLLLLVGVDRHQKVLRPMNAEELLEETKRREVELQRKMAYWESQAFRNHSEGWVR